MHINEQDLAAAYRQYSDDEIAARAAQADVLTDVARAALQEEIRRRGMTSAQIEKVHAKELHREARFDQKETLRRKRTLLYILTRNDPKGWIWAGLIFLGFLLFKWLWSRFH